VPAKTVVATHHRPGAVATAIAKQQHALQLTKADVPKIPKGVLQHVHLGKGEGYMLLLILTHWHATFYNTWRTYKY